jgi:hypothetical protein
MQDIIAVHEPSGDAMDVLAVGADVGIGLVRGLSSRAVPRPIAADCQNSRFWLIQIIPADVGI